MGGHAVGRRAADAGARASADGGAEAAAARRAVARPGAARRARHLFDHRHAAIQRAWPCCSSSRTRARRCRSPITAMCWKPASSRSKGRVPHSRRIRASRKPILDKLANGVTLDERRGPQAACRRGSIGLKRARLGPLSAIRRCRTSRRPSVIAKDSRDRRDTADCPHHCSPTQSACCSHPPISISRRFRAFSRPFMRTTSISPISTFSTRRSKAGASRKASSRPERSASTAVLAFAR